MTYGELRSCAELVEILYKKRWPAEQAEKAVRCQELRETYKATMAPYRAAIQAYIEEFGVDGVVKTNSPHVAKYLRAERELGASEIPWSFKPFLEAGDLETKSGEDLDALEILGIQITEKVEAAAARKKK